MQVARGQFLAYVLGLLNHGVSIQCFLQLQYICFVRGIVHKNIKHNIFLNIALQVISVHQNKAKQAYHE